MLGERGHALAKAVGMQTAELLRPVVLGVQRVLTNSANVATVATDFARAIDQLTTFAPNPLVDFVRWLGNWCARVGCIQALRTVDATVPGTLPNETDIGSCLAVLATPCDTSSLVGHVWAT